MDELLRKSALDYHRLPTPGKISVVPTKALLNHAAFPGFGTLLSEEALSIARCVAQDDFRKGVEGMLSRKPAIFD